MMLVSQILGGVFATLIGWVVALPGVVRSSGDVVPVSGPPDVIFLGVSKTGTSSLHEYLVHNAGVCGGVRKEYHYFAYHHESPGSYDEYVKNFRACNSSQLTLDASPSNGGRRALLIVSQAFVPESFKTKYFVFIMREPVDRLLSWYNFMRAQANIPCTGNHNSNTIENCALFKSLGHSHLESFKEYFEFHEYAIETGSYVESMRRLKVIPRRQLFVMSFDTLRSNTSDSLQRLTRFLGTTAYNFDLPHTNEGDKKLEAANQTKSAMLCSDYFHYSQLFAHRNKGLIDIINGHLEKPPDEPYFPEFIDKFDHCRN